MKKIIAKIRFILDILVMINLSESHVLSIWIKGRVAIDKEYRGQGIGRELINGCENIAQQILKRKIIIELSAQIQAEKFYESLGYNQVNDTIYLDAGIEHVDMRKEIN